MMTPLLRPEHRPARSLSTLVPTGLVVTSAGLMGGEATVTDITLDSRTVVPGSLYVALPGTRAHGAAFADKAVRQGAVAILTDEAGRDRAVAAGVPVVVAEDARVAMALVSDAFFGHPSADLTMIGITGTNGKTTTAFLVEAALLAAGRHTGTIGTIGFRLDGDDLPSGRTTVTTPESPDLQALLAVMAERGADSVTMEASSHALALHRVDGIGFDVVAFTNLGRDHLDFHPTMQDYFEAKARLFEAVRCRVAVVHVDDEWGRRLADRVRGTSVRLVTTGTGPDADYRLLGCEPLPDGSRVRASTPHGDVDLTLDLPGEHNARNFLTALAVADAVGLDRASALDGLAHAQVPGRLQKIDLGPAAPTVRVDFAHTPQAIEQVLHVTAPEGRTIVVLGAGGDRDKAKRGQMGRAAAAADLVIVTDDNPRTENPADIRAAVVAGAREGSAEVVEVDDRRAAIALALQRCGPADTVLVLGKGHERGQEVAGRVIDFDDAAVVAEQWHRLARADGQQSGNDAKGAAE